MNDKELLKRGEEIFAELEELAGDYTVQSKRRSWACSIVRATTTIHEQPIPKDDICIALAKAEQMGKRVTIEPDAEFTGAGDGIVSDQYDGWTYHIVIS